uniref:Cell adhesion molecule n=1 Tax=Rhipicephalus appendiculatus TaxID=34631 RepID=A0A131YT80_RHIAP
MRTSPVMDGRHWRHLASGVRLLLLLYVFPGTQTASCKSVFSPISGGRFLPMFSRIVCLKYLSQFHAVNTVGWQSSVMFLA